MLCGKVTEHWYIVAFVDPIRDFFGSMLSDAGSTQDVEPLIMRTSTLQAKGIEKTMMKIYVWMYQYIYIYILMWCSNACNYAIMPGACWKHALVPWTIMKTYAEISKYKEICATKGQIVSNLAGFYPTWQLHKCWVPCSKDDLPIESFPTIIGSDWQDLTMSSYPY